MAASSAHTTNISVAAALAAPEGPPTPAEPALADAIIGTNANLAPAASAAAWPAPAVEDIPPRPIKRHHIPDEVAEMLATLPRNKWDDPTSAAALGGAAASFPSAVGALVSAVQRQPFSLQLFESIQVAIFLCFAVWFVARKRSKKGKTSADLLEELRNREPHSVDKGALVP